MQTDRANTSASDALAAARECRERGDLAAAEQACRAALALAPGHAEALLLLGAVHLEQGAWKAAVEALEGALAAAPGHPLVRERLCNALFAHVNVLKAGRRQREAIPALRRLLDFFPQNPIIRNNLADALAATGEPAQLADFTREVSPAELGLHLFVACMPKSGSSFLSNCLMRLSGFERSFISFAYMQNEQELYLPDLVMQARKNKVTQQHCRATEANLLLMQAFGIRPVVLVRRLEDVVASFLDFYDQGAVHTSFLREDWSRLDRTAKLDAVIDVWLPWYVQFYVSWIQAERRKRLDMLWISYEDLSRDKAGTLAHIARFCGLPATPAAIAQTLDEVEAKYRENRMNQGVVGRGAAMLDADQKARIARLAKPFPSVDFSRIGL